MLDKGSKYRKSITVQDDKGNLFETEIDVYDVLKAFEVVNPALQHLVKKALGGGNRGHKNLETDLNEIIVSAIRAIELEGYSSEWKQKKETYSRQQYSWCN